MKKIFTLAALLMLASTSFSQENENMTQTEKNTNKLENIEIKIGKISNLKISGYLQGQWQWAEQKGVAAFQDGGSFPTNSDNRFAVRRGRIKFTYTLGIAQLVIQPDFTEKGVSLKDAYINVTSKNKVIGGQVGVFDRPFGYEISYSSSLRESPERSRVFLSLFPGERDLGAMMILRGKSGVLADFTLNAGLFNGNGIGQETDSRKDFIGRLTYLKKTDNMQFGGAFSYYNGGVQNPTITQDGVTSTTNYTFDKGVGFVGHDMEKGSYAQRHYYGLGATWLYQSCVGTTNIRAEYLWGKQPGTIKTNADPSGTSLGVGDQPFYLRQFAGFYAILVQDIGQTKHSVVLKYDFYDPNTKIKGNEIGKLQGTGVADIAYNTFGFGYLFRMNANIRLMAYYDMVYNEKSANLASTNPLSNFSGHIKQSVLTLRAQIKF